MISSLIDLFFPRVCLACSQFIPIDMHGICLRCRHELPVTNFHLSADQTFERVLAGRAKIVQGTALFHFEKKGLVQQLLHKLKYKGYESIGCILGDWLGGELRLIPSYQNIDVVLPVPLHKKRERQRGYNQVAKFAMHIAKALQADYLDTVLIKTTHTPSQIKKKRLARWHDTKAVFAINDYRPIQNKHILLVDDLVTTGATLEACIQVLNIAPHIKISIATIAIA